MEPWSDPRESIRDYFTYRINILVFFWAQDIQKEVEKKKINKIKFETQT